MFKGTSFFNNCFIIVVSQYLSGDGHCEDAATRKMTLDFDLELGGIKVKKVNILAFYFAL